MNTQRSNSSKVRRGRCRRGEWAQWAWPALSRRAVRDCLSSLTLCPRLFRSHPFLDDLPLFLIARLLLSAFSIV